MRFPAPARRELNTFDAAAGQAHSSPRSLSQPHTHRAVDGAEAEVAGQDVERADRDIGPDGHRACSACGSSCFACRAWLSTACMQAHGRAPYGQVPSCSCKNAAPPALTGEVVVIQVHAGKRCVVEDTPIARRDPACQLGIGQEQPLDGLRHLQQRDCGCGSSGCGEGVGSAAPLRQVPAGRLLAHGRGARFPSCEGNFPCHVC